MAHTSIDDNHVASIFASLYFNNMAADKRVHLVTTENGIENMSLVFNDNADRTGVMHRAIRKAVPSLMIDYKRDGDKDVLVVHGDAASIAKQIRDSDPEGSIAAFMTTQPSQSHGNAAQKRADTDNMRAANEDPTLHFNL